jgi:hypothetical protein
MSDLTVISLFVFGFAIVGVIAVELTEKKMHTC